MANSKSRLEAGTPETQARMKELSERARAARQKAVPPTRPVTLSADINEFTGNMGATFSDMGTFFNPGSVHDTRISQGAQFPGGK